MGTNNGTVERILDGAVRALARHGHHKLSMSDVCAEAGVSRGTLYRYFKSREALIEAIAVHVKEGVRDELRRAVNERPEPEHRVRTILDVVIEYQWLHPESTQIVNLEPGFAQQFIRGVFPEFVEIVAEALEPASAHIAPIRDGLLTVEQLARLMLRVAASAVFVPGPDGADLAVWMARLTGGAAMPATDSARPVARSA